MTLTESVVVALILRLITVACYKWLSISVVTPSSSITIVPTASIVSSPSTVDKPVTSIALSFILKTRYSPIAYAVHSIRASLTMCSHVSSILVYP